MPNARFTNLMGANLSLKFRYFHVSEIILGNTYPDFSRFRVITDLKQVFLYYENGHKCIDCMKLTLLSNEMSVSPFLLTNPNKLSETKIKV